MCCREIWKLSTWLLSHFDLIWVLLHQLLSSSFHQHICNMFSWESDQILLKRRHEKFCYPIKYLSEPGLIYQWYSLQAYSTRYVSGKPPPLMANMMILTDYEIWYRAIYNSSTLLQYSMSSQVEANQGQKHFVKSVNILTGNCQPFVLI